MEETNTTTDEAVLWAVVVFIIIAGIWLAGLTYMMWRATQKKAQGLPVQEPVEESPSPGGLKPT